MSKYYKAEDAIKSIAEHDVYKGDFEDSKKWAKILLDNAPIFEVKGGELEDAIILTKEAYSDLCLRASKVSEDIISRERLKKSVIPIMQEFSMPNRGEWVASREYVRWECSECGFLSIDDYPYCPWCGAKMI